jgi:pimeloyl-ACP methyl ester carboxylesterase
MQQVTSRDGTQIGHEISGRGPLVVLIDGALCYRSFGPMPRLAALLAPHFAVIDYDRRGRGDSGDTQPYAVDREVEDVEALIDAAGGSAFVFGTSSGAALALEVAIRLGDKIKGLAMYEPPYNSDAGSAEE